MLRIFTLLLLISFVFISCEDDVNLNAEWSDITVVYGVLNRNDANHYIKLNKAFLGEVDAYEMAKQADSIQYAKAQKVYLLEYKLISDGLDPYYASNWERTNEDTIWCTRTNEFPKNENDINGNPGAFGTQVNYIYKTSHTLKERMRYVLQAEIDGKEDLIEAETFMIYGLFVKAPLPSPYKVDLSNYQFPFKAEWDDAIFAKIYQVEMVFNYCDVIGHDTTFHKVHFTYPDIVSSNIRLPGEPSKSTFTQIVGGEAFFNNLNNKIDSDIEVDKRIPMYLDFYFYAGGNDLNTYLKVSQSNSGYGQSQPEYSNIKNGVGIFDSRYVHASLKHIMHNSTLDSLSVGYYTQQLKFVNWSLPLE